MVEDDETFELPGDSETRLIFRPQRQWQFVLLQWQLDQLIKHLWNYLIWLDWTDRSTLYWETWREKIEQNSMYIVEHEWIDSMAVERRSKTIDDHRKHYDKLVWIINMKIVFFPCHLQLVGHVQFVRHLFPRLTIVDRWNRTCPLFEDLVRRYISKTMMPMNLCHCYHAKYENKSMDLNFSERT